MLFGEASKERIGVVTLPRPMEATGEEPYYVELLVVPGKCSLGPSMKGKGADVGLQSPDVIRAVRVLRAHIAEGFDHGITVGEVINASLKVLLRESQILGQTALSDRKVPAVSSSWHRTKLESGPDPSWV